MRYRRGRWRRFWDGVGDWFDDLSDMFWEVLIKLFLSAVAAGLIWALDQEVTGGTVDLPLWLCIAIGLGLVFGCWFIIVHVNDSD